VKAILLIIFVQHFNAIC